MDQFLVAMPEAVNADTRVVACRHAAQRDLCSGVFGSAMLDGGYRRVMRIAVIIRTVVVIKGRCRQQQTRLERMDPRQAGQSIALALHVPDPGRLSTRVIGDLIVVPPQRR